jgi:hypothetical protein
VHVQQRAGDPVDGLAVQQRRVDPLAVREHDRFRRRLEIEPRLGATVRGEVAVGGDLVDLVQGSVDRAHARPPFKAWMGGDAVGLVERATRARRRLEDVRGSLVAALTQAPNTLAATRSLAAVPA